MTAQPGELDALDRGRNDKRSLVQYEHRHNCELRNKPGAECKAHWHKVVRLEDHATHLGEFDIVACDDCKLGFTDPYPTEETVLNLYSGRDTDDYDVIQGSPVDALKDFLSVRMLRKLTRGIRVERALDFATGNGRFALSAAKAFPRAQVDVVDFQKQAPPALARHDSPVRYLAHGAFAAEDRRYDLIVLRHVLEHVHHPVSFIERLGKRLSPTGILYVEVPNLDSGCAKLFGDKWKGYYVPRHLFHFSEASLAETVTRAGLKAEIGKNEMPLMGNMIGILTGLDSSKVPVQLLGAALHPLQLAVEAWHRSATCVHAKCRLPGAA